jgi:hypothetical protein
LAVALTTGETMDDDDATTSDMVVIEWFDAPTDASRAAATLVENGVGAVLDDDSPPRTGLAVLGSDAVRARQILGLSEPDTPAHEDELKAMNRSWLVPVLIFGVALVTIPLIAFFLSFKLSGG